jgi:hypothetical protein
MASKTKSMAGKDGGRKLATDAGRKHQKSGGESKKVEQTSAGMSRRSGSSKQRKG